MQAPKNTQRQNSLSLLFEGLKKIRIDVTLPVLLTFILLQIFKIVDLLITNRTLGNILIIPFQIIIFMLPAWLFARFRNPSRPTEYLAKLRIKLPSPYQIPLIASGIITMTCGCLFISMLCGGTNSLSEGFTLYNTFVSQSSGGFLETAYLIIAYAAVPAFCEELIYRGMLCKEFEKHNVFCGIIASAVFFALLHFDVAQFPVYLFSGIFLALSMYATGSVIVPMIIHFCYNIMGLFGQTFLNAFYNITGSLGLFAFLIFTVGMLFSALFCSFASKCYAIRSRSSYIPDRPILPHPSRLPSIIGEILLTPWSIASICFYIVVMVVYSAI